MGPYWLVSTCQLCLTWSYEEETRQTMLQIRWARVKCVSAHVWEVLVLVAKGCGKTPSLQAASSPRKWVYCSVPQGVAERARIHVLILLLSTTDVVLDFPVLAFPQLWAITWKQKPNKPFLSKKLFVRAFITVAGMKLEQDRIFLNEISNYKCFNKKGFFLSCKI